MIRAFLIAGAALWAAGAAAALTPVLVPDCEENGAQYYSYEFLPGGLIATEIYSATTSVDALVSCQAGQAVVAEPSGSYTIYFYDIVKTMAESAERYTFEDVVKRAREAGWNARIETFDRGSCLCGL